MPLTRISSSTILQMESEPIGPVVIDGVHCRLRVGEEALLYAAIQVNGEVVDGKIEIGHGCTLNGAIRFIRGKGGELRIGDKTSFNGVDVTMHEGARVVIGRDCMFSTEIHLDPSDPHPLFDRATGARLNPPQDITIGDHVWVGTRVMIAKGVTIGSGSIIGAGSRVTADIPENVLAVGSPCRVVRENVTWTRDMDEEPRLVADSAPPAPAAAPRQGWFARLAGRN